MSTEQAKPGVEERANRAAEAIFNRLYCYRAFDSCVDGEEPDVIAKIKGEFTEVILAALMEEGRVVERKHEKSYGDLIVQDAEPGTITHPQDCMCHNCLPGSAGANPATGAGSFVLCNRCDTSASPDHLRDGICVSCWKARCAELERERVTALAATPYLLAACKEVMDEFEDRYDGAPDAGYQWMAHLMEILSHAIMKAQRRNPNGELERPQ